MWASSLTWYETVPWIIVVLWIMQLTLILAGMRYRQSLKASTPVKNRNLPRLSVIVAARNEEDCIERCVRSLVSQDHPDFEVIAVDDRSTDGTNRIMTALAAEFPDRLRVLRIPSLPTGWFGKVHALHSAMQIATGDWICFTDADCEQLSNQTLTLAMQEAFDRKVDLLTLTPQLVLNSIWEKITVPLCSWVMMVWFRPGSVNNPQSSTSYANGAFMLMNRTCYDAVGGWARVRTRICEDVAFAHLAKASGAKLMVLQNEGLYQASMYDSVRESWNGWSRIFYGTLSRTAIVVTLLRLIICSIVPTAVVLSMMIGALSVPTGTGIGGNAIAVALALIMTFQLIQALFAFRAMGSHPAWSLTARIGQVILFGMLFRALLNGFGLATLNWGGAVFHRGRMIQPTLASVRPRI